MILGRLSLSPAAMLCLIHGRPKGMAVQHVCFHLAVAGRGQGSDPWARYATVMSIEPKERGGWRYPRNEEKQKTKEKVNQKQSHFGKPRRSARRSQRNHGDPGIVQGLKAHLLAAATRSPDFVQISRSGWRRIDDQACLPVHDTLPSSSAGRAVPICQEAHAIDRRRGLANVRQSHAKVLEYPSQGMQS